MKSRKKKEKDKKNSKGTNNPPLDEHSQARQNVQQEEMSQHSMLQNLKSLSEDEFNSKFEKMLVSCLFICM